MIIEFSVKNFRSIKELQTISFVATGLKSSKENNIVDKNNISKAADTKVFKTIGIYGANASGKSNIIKALDYFIKVISREPSSSSNLGLLCQPFFFQDNCKNVESYFQIVIEINNEKYRYGFTVKENQKTKPNDPKITYSSEIITGEWLFGKKEKNNGELFLRKGREVKNNLPIKQQIPDLPYEHSLFISHVAAYDSDNICVRIRSYLKRMVTSNINDTINYDNFRWLSVSFIKGIINNEKKSHILNLLSSFNINYQDVNLQENQGSSEVFPQDKITFSKSYKNSDNSSSNVTLNLNLHESAGTQKLFDIAGLVLRAFRLKEPAFIILDEIDSNFHPSLLIKLIQLFNTPTLNKSNSQLLFTSHDTNLMSPSIMRRDQFYFTEKKDDESTRLYSLADLKGIRNDADFAKQYLAGYYGAVPIFDDYLEINK